MTDVHWPDIRSITSFQTFMPNSTNDHNHTDVEKNSYQKKNYEFYMNQENNNVSNPLMDPEVTSSTDETPLPPLVPVRTVFPSDLKVLGTPNGETVSISRKTPTKMVPVNLQPVASIFDSLNEDIETSPKFLATDKSDCKPFNVNVDNNDNDQQSGNLPTDTDSCDKDESTTTDNSDDESMQENIFFVVVDLLGEDERFGFSVIGGTDEGFTPRIESINPGSPADKTDLEVGDEILEVNGKTLDDASHTEVISHIHQCIRSRTISLRVKRKLGNKLVLDLAKNSNVQDAFVIAVEEKARDRLERLSALRKIKPIDMTKLSHELNDSTSPENSEKLNGIIESSSIYVTSVPELSHGSIKKIECGDNQSDCNVLNENNKNSEFNGENFSEEIELKQEILENSETGKFNGTQHIELFEAINDNTNYSQVDRLDISNMENKPHREMAVDVPDSFVATAKQSPRYPPPRQNGSAINNGSGRISKDYSANKIFHTPSSSMDSAASNNFKKPTPLPKPKFEENVHSVKLNGVDITDNELHDTGQLDRIRKYQDDMKKRKEEEDRIAKEEEFLRSSLRGSKKLQALESYPASVPPIGVVNSAFQSDDEIIPLQSDIKNISYNAQSAPVGPEELLEALSRMQMNLKNNGYHDDLSKVNALLQNPEFKNCLRIHKKIQDIWCFQTPPTPLCTDAQDLVQEVLNILQESSIEEATELIEILSKYEVEGLILAHDKIAEREMVAPLQCDEDILDRASQYTDDSIKIVRIDKTNEPLGATVRNEGEAVIIGRIVKGGAAEKSGLLHEGDEILEVNEIEMRGKSVNDVCDILATMMGTLTFIIIPSQNERPITPVRDTVMHVKAHFDYEPDDDLYNPCRELGISFQKGDILHVINQDDGNWWQAYREGEEDQTLAGLIPSKNFQHQRESMKQTIVGDNNNKEKSKKSKFLCARKPNKKKKKKVMYNAHYNEDMDNEEILTYEEVALYYPRANKKRPIVLIGPPNIGRHELRQKLMEDLERFAAAIPHTSRLKKESELDGQDYHFITRSQFESDIVSRKFVEHGEFERNYYGTSLNAIRSVVNSSKICVLNLHPQSLKILKNSDLKPYVVFVAPPSLEKLRQNRAKMGANVKDDELKDIIEKAREMEDNYGHYFDMIIINSDINKAYHELLKEINILEREPQWVPAVWLHDEIN